MNKTTAHPTERSIRHHSIASEWVGVVCRRRRPPSPRRPPPVPRRTCAMEASILAAMDKDALKKQIENMKYQASMERWPLSKSIAAWVPLHPIMSPRFARGRRPRGRAPSFWRADRSGAASPPFFPWCDFWGYVAGLGFRVGFHVGCILSYVDFFIIIIYHIHYKFLYFIFLCKISCIQSSIIDWV